MKIKSSIYLVFAFFLVILLVVLNDKVSQSIEYIKSSFYHAEKQTLNEFAFNIDTIIQKRVQHRALYSVLKNNKALREQLEEVLSVLVSRKYKYAYVVQKRDRTNGKYRILLDGSLRDKSAFGEPFNVLNSAWDRVYKTKKPTVFSDKELESLWMTYLYPVMRNGQVDAIIAIEFSKQQIDATLEYITPAHKFMEVMIFVLIGSMVLLFTFILMWYRKNRESEFRKKELEQNMVSLERALVKAKASERSKSEF